MQMTFSVRHGEVPDRVRARVEREVQKLSKYFERLVEADIILDHEGGHRHIAEVRLHTSTDTHFAASEASDWRTAIDRTIAKLRRQLKRHKGKLSQRSPTGLEQRREAAGPPAPTAPESSVPSDWARMSSEQAISRLEQSDEDVLLFIDLEDEAAKIARRTEAGSISVVEADVFEIEER